MNKQLVTKNVGALLKEFSFDWKVIHWYYVKQSDRVNSYRHPSFQNHNAHNSKHRISAPDLFTVEQWLREVHNLHIALIPSSELAYWKVRVYSSDGYENMTGTFDAHDSALSAGISYCLTLLKEKHNA